MMQAAVYANNASMGDKLIEEVPYKDGNFSSLAIFLSSLRPRKEKNICLSFYFIKQSGIYFSLSVKFFAFSSPLLRMCFLLMHSPF